MPSKEEMDQISAADLIGPKAIAESAKGVPLSALVIVEYLDDDGDIALGYRRSADCPNYKALGMLKTIEALLLDLLLESEIGAYYDGADGEPGITDDLDDDE